MQDKTTVQAQMFANRLRKRFRHLKKWAQRGNIGAFRLYDRDIPEIPLVLDFYVDCNLPCEAALCGSLYKRPYEKDAAEEEYWLSVMKDSASFALGIKHENIFIKQRQKQKGLSQYEKLGNSCYEKIIKEGNLLFKVNLSDYLDTGLFIDRRLLRDMVRNESNGKKVLNLFSYTGAFSVCAAAGGAVLTDSVDLSNTYLNWAQENFLLNGYKAALQKNSRKDAEAQRTQSCNSISCRNPHKLLKGDVLEYIKNAVKNKRQWDIIIVDPPAFSNSKKMSDNFDLNRDLEKLLTHCLMLLSPNGKIFVSVNLRRSAPEAHELEEKLRNSSGYANLKITDISARITDEDFTGKKMPKAFFIDKIQ